MASAMELCGYKNTFPVASMRALPCQLLPCRIGFAASVAPVPISCCGARRVSIDKAAAFTVSCCKATTESDVVVEKNEAENGGIAETEKSYTSVMKFGGSSVASAERMREVASLILSFPEERPVIVLSAMGKTTSLLLLVFFYVVVVVVDSHQFLFLPSDCYSRT